jgi:hypothetical protein
VPTRPDVDIYSANMRRGSHTHQQHLTHVADLDWPLREWVHAYVLDDGQPDARAMARTLFHYIVQTTDRTSRRLVICGTRSRTTFTILDADFCTRPDFLREVIPYFIKTTSSRSCRRHSSSRCAPEAGLSAERASFKSVLQGRTGQSQL